MTAGQETTTRCAYCGETDAWPRHICLVRATAAMGVSPDPFPCSYSVEGCARIEAEIEDRIILARQEPVL